MNHLLQQPKLWQKFHECEVTILQVNWKDDNIESMLVQYPQERFRGIKQYYHADESKDFSLTLDGEPVFTAVKL